MAFTFNKQSLTNQVAFVAALISMLVIGALALTIAETAANRMSAQQEAQLQSQVRIATSLIDLSYSAATGAVARMSGSFAGNFTEPMTLQSAQSIKVGERSTPALLYRGQMVNLDYSIVDNFSREAGGLATIFVRSGDDFVRISTNVTDKSGKRAIGTLLDHAHPAYKPLLTGQDYTGPATLFGKLHATHYQAIKSSGGQVIGALFVGTDASGWFEQVRKSLSSVQFLTSGYLFVLQTAGANRGIALMHPKLVGKNFLDMPDQAGNKPFGALLDKPEGDLHYSWLDDKGIVIDKTATFLGSPSWGGVVVVGTVPRDELVRESVILRNTILGAGLVAAIVMSGLLMMFLRRELASIGTLVRLVKRAGEGDLTIDSEIPNSDANSRNELHIISRHLAEMISKMRDTIQGISERTVVMAATSLQLHQTAEELTTATSTQSSAASAMAAGVEQLAVSVNMVSDNAQHVDQITHSTQTLTNTGSSSLKLAMSAMQQIEETVQVSATQIELLAQHSARISTVVALIKEIADQTNLLALNAAIEAARAGEQGRGFSVVADEVRKLAERTASSTAEIEQIVRSIQGGSDDAMSSMTTTVRIVRIGASNVQDVGTAITQISAGASAAVVASSDISHALREQAAASNNLGLEVEKVSVLSEETSSAAHATSSSARQMSSVSEEISASLRRFKLR